MNATQTQAQALWAASTSQQSLDRTSSLLQSVQQYTRSEQTCVAFLQSRIRRNEDEVQALAAELQRETPTEAKLARVVQLRHAIASDREALNALLTFAASACLGWLDPLGLIADVALGVLMLAGFLCMLVGQRFEQERDTERLNAALARHQTPGNR